MEENELIKYEGGLVKSVSTAINVANKLLALAQPQLIRECKINCVKY